MKRFKKVISIFLVLILIVLGAVGCGVFLFETLKANVSKSDVVKNNTALRAINKLKDAEGSDNFYKVLGKADFINKGLLNNTKYFKKYGGLDELGRPSWVFSCITSEQYKLEKTKPRQEIKVDPVGWVKPNPRVILSDGKNTYKGFLYNRSHLLADSLGGDPIKENLITGTRLQNVGWNKKGSEGGMAYGETLARDWLNKNKGYLQYEVICHYEGKDLLSDYQIVNIKSSDGTLDLQIKVFNGLGNVKMEKIK
jgi:DNA-entry nuclease